MDDVELLISRYRSLREDDETKPEIIEALEEFLNPHVVDLFLEILEDFSEFDLARIEVLKILQLAADSLSGHQREHASDVIIKVLRSDRDDLVRTYAASALAGFGDVPRVLETVEKVVKDEDDDIDVRYSALFVIQANLNMPQCIEALRRIVPVPVLGESAKRTLDERDKGA